MSETNEIVKEVKSSLMNMNANCGDCFGSGYEISLCGNASIYQGQCEGKYCLVEGMGNETLSILFNPVNQLHLIGAVYQNCK